jgi:hypothetical protein
MWSRYEITECTLTVADWPSVSVFSLQYLLYAEDLPPEAPHHLHFEETELAFQRRKINKLIRQDSLYRAVNTHHTSVTETNQLILYTVTMTVCSEIHIKHCVGTT